jgi:predicted metal-dependent phosphoesterase TrpH
MHHHVLKCDFHLHTASDRQDRHIRYSDKELIDLAAKSGFDVLSLTFHDCCYFPATIKAYAQKKGILLIPGIEKTVDGKHVLLINYPFADAKSIEKISTFAELRRYLERLKTADRESLLTVFAHPRFWIIGMGKKAFRKNKDLCDALEYQSFRHAFYDFNEDVTWLARKHGKALIGNTDAHTLEQFNHTYTLVDSQKYARAVIRAIKQGKTTVISKPLSTRAIIKRLHLDLLPDQKLLNTANSKSA